MQVFLLQSYYFDRDDVALKNFAKYFLHQSHEEREHAEKLMKLQNQRGGRIFLQDIKVRSGAVGSVLIQERFVVCLQVERGQVPLWFPFQKGQQVTDEHSSLLQSIHGTATQSII